MQGSSCWVFAESSEKIILSIHICDSAVIIEYTLYLSAEK